MLNLIAKNTFLKLLGVFLFVIPIAVYFFNIIYFSRNIPYLDDYDAVLGFLIDFKNEVSIFENIKRIFNWHNDHRIAFAHLVALGQYYLFGSINFKHLIILGNFSILGILLILWKSVKPERNKFLYFSPAVFLLFSFSYYEASFWAMVTLSGLAVVVFSLAAISLLGNEKKCYFLWACIFASLAVFSQGNGKIVLVCCLAILLFKRDFKKSFIWLVLSLLLVVLPDQLFGHHQQNYTPILRILHAPRVHVLSVFSFLGSYFDYLRLELAIGVLIILYFLYLIVIKYYIKNLVLFVIILFVILNAFAVGFARPSINFPSRYAIYSALILSVIYLTLVDLFKNGTPKLLISFLSFAIISISSYQYLTVPLKLYYYNLTEKQYEKHLVLNQYSTNSLNRDNCNRILRKELGGFASDPIIKLLPYSHVNKFILGTRTNTSMVIKENFWWYSHIIPFSRNLRAANQLNIYRIGNMYEEQY